jgi:hypothetical protein
MSIVSVILVVYAPPTLALTPYHPNPNLDPNLKDAVHCRLSYLKRITSHTTTKHNRACVRIRATRLDLGFGQQRLFISYSRKGLGSEYRV